ncbi:MAG: YlmH/Sll1252 family protein [Clostridiales bacterium]|nr:YlmH/Sll1252 family protein [Clostridiales bacterium]
MTEEKELQQLKKRLIELADRSYRDNIYTFTPFLGLAGQQIFYELQPELAYAGWGMEGGSPLCERKIIRFGSEVALGYEEPYPVACLKVEPLTPKFAEPLTHRDFLGAIMNLGMERDRIGDIFVREQAAVFFCQDVIASYLMENLQQVKHTRVRCFGAEEAEELCAPVLESVSISVASPRIDGVVSKLYNIPRSRSLELFRAGRVYVDGRLAENNSYSLREGDTVTVRGFGRFLYTGEQGETRKGKVRIGAKLYR